MSASDCYRCKGTGYDDDLNQICTCSHGRRYRARNMHATHFSADELIAASERNAAERAQAGGKEQCKARDCTAYVDPQVTNGFCANCHSEWWFENFDVS